MSSGIRRIQLKIRRKMGLEKPRWKAIRVLKGTPYRRCEVGMVNGVFTVIRRYT